MLAIYKPKVKGMTILKYISVSEAAEKWRISDRMIRKYCDQKLIEGAFLVGTTWIIPEDAPRPDVVVYDNLKLTSAAKKVVYQMRKNTHFGLYEYIQVDLAYSSSRMASNRLTRKQILEIYRTGKISVAFEPMKIDDLIEIISHFSACHHMIETLAEPLTAPYIRKLHRLMFHGTLADRKGSLHIGELRKTPDKKGMHADSIQPALNAIIKEYESKRDVELIDILAFHVAFEKIHPFEDGNGRVGRLIMMKECLRYGLVPFIIDDKKRGTYNRGIACWDADSTVLTDVAYTGQCRFQNKMSTCKLFEYYRPETGRASDMEDWDDED